MKSVVIYSDGGADPNPGLAGYGAVILGLSGKPVELLRAYVSSTNNRMEIRGALAALEFLQEPHVVTLHTDSKYLIKSASLWLPGWKRKGWKLKDGGPVKNVDLFKALDVQIARHRIHWKHVRGHSGNQWNERCDALTWEARRCPVEELWEDSRQ